MRPTARIPVLVLVLLAPWSAEIAWGGLPVADVPLVLLFLAPLYGAAALLVREVARRTGRGWPTMLLLGAAFGVVQAGVVDQSLFNPAYGRYDFQHPVHVGGLDISLYYLMAFVSGHVVASIAAPIAIAEAWSHRGTEAWLTKRAVRAAGLLYVLASVVNHVGVKADDGRGFQASPLQTAVAVATAAALVGLGLAWRRRPATTTRVPAPWLLGALAFVAYLLYLPGEGATALVVAALVVVAVVTAVGRWSRSTAWTTTHATALAVGAFLVGVVAPFLNEPYDPSDGARAELASDLVAAAVCLAVVAATAVRRRALRVAERAVTSAG
ncbi:hypothetical protein ABFT23_15410 [Nocardioides sp. C4-1]|uniref:hypothetical protein n=1 Tax=Nocardioides sp. C4-1 TaxID=3151851 RepID=UPI0032673514